MRSFFFIPPTYANIYQTPFRRADPQESPPPFGSHPARCKRGTKQACSGPEHRHTISFTFALLILQGQKSSFLGHRNRVLRPPKGAAHLRGLIFFEKTWKCHRISEPTFVEQFRNVDLECGLRFLIVISEGLFLEGLSIGPLGWRVTFCSQKCIFSRFTKLGLGPI